MLQYEKNDKGNYDIKGTRIKLTSGEMIKLKQFAFEKAYEFLGKSPMTSFSTLDIFKKADEIVGWATLVDDKECVR